MNGEIPMKKRALMALLLVMALCLSSCALIVKDKEVDAKTVILKLGDEEITKAEVQNATNSMLYQQYQYYAMLGSDIDLSNPDVIASAQSSAVTQLKNEMTLRAKAKELGLDVLTEEDNTKIKERAQSNWDADKSLVQSSYLSEEEKKLEGEELDKAILAQMETMGLKMEDYEEEAKESIINSKVRDYAIKDVTVSDEEVKADYDSKVAADEEKYKENASSWASADRSGTTLYYAPAGLRRVKQILIRFKSEDQTAISDANTKVSDALTKVSDAQKVLDDEAASEEDKTKAQESLTAANADLDAAQAELKTAVDAAFARLDEDADAVLAALEANPDDWDKLQEEKNEDPGMKAGAVNAEKGYAVCENMSGFDSAFVNAAMALENVGDVSGKIRGESNGYYIIKYVADVTEGSVDFESVKESLHSALLTSKQNSTYTDTLAQWVKDAGIKEDLGALKD